MSEITAVDERETKNIAEKGQEIFVKANENSLASATAQAARIVIACRENAIDTNELESIGSAMIADERIVESTKEEINRLHEQENERHRPQPETSAENESNRAGRWVDRPLHAIKQHIKRLAAEDHTRQELPQYDNAQTTAIIAGVFDFAHELHVLDNDALFDLLKRYDEYHFTDNKGSRVRKEKKYRKIAEEKISNASKSEKIAA